MGGVTVKIMSLLKTKDYSKPERVKTVYGGGMEQLEENTIKSVGNLIKSIRNLFKLKKRK